jgi:hypothetical protein
MKTTSGKNRYGRDGSLQLSGTIGLKVGLNSYCVGTRQERSRSGGLSQNEEAAVTHDKVDRN